jgi:hypothetical protein
MADARIASGAARAPGGMQARRAGPVRGGEVIHG